MRLRQKPASRNPRAFGIRLAAETDFKDFEVIAEKLPLPTVYRLLVEMVQEILYLCMCSPFSFPKESLLLRLRANRADSEVWKRLAMRNVQRKLLKSESKPLTISFPKKSREEVATLSGELRWSEGQVILESLQTFCQLVAVNQPLVDPPDIIFRFRALKHNEVHDQGNAPEISSSILFATPRPKPEPTSASNPPLSVRLVKSDVSALRTLAQSFGIRFVNRLVVFIVLDMLDLCALPAFSLEGYRNLLQEKISRDDRAMWYQLSCANILRTVANPKTQPIRLSFPGESRRKLEMLGREMHWSTGQVILEALQTFCVLAGGNENPKLPGIFRQAWVPRQYRERTNETSGKMVASELNKSLGLVRQPFRLDQPESHETIILTGGLFKDG